MYWRTPNANVELKADLTVSQTLDDWRVWGTVESLRGTYYFLENKFAVDTGNLQFDQIEPLNPKVDATAHSDVPSGTTSETVTITLSGRVRNPTVQLVSSPHALTEQEIVQLMTVGRFGFGLAAGQRYAPGGEAIVAGATGGQYLLRQMAQQFPEISPILGDLEVGTQVVEVDGRGKPVPQIGINRYFTPEFRVRYSQVLGSPSSGAIGLNVRDLGAEYRISRIFFLTGEILERRTGSSSTPTVSQSELEYNLDLRARYEY
jgi:translocation and assembly module TamB